MIQNIQRVTNVVLVVGLSLMVALTFVDVLGRRLFNTPVFGANDITEHLMAIIVFAGLPLLTANRGHLSIDLLDQWLIRPGLWWWHKAVDILIAVILVFISWQYYIAAQDAILIREVSPALTIPRSWSYSFICAFSAFAAVTALLVGPPQHIDHSEEEYE